MEDYSIPSVTHCLSLLLIRHSFSSPPVQLPCFLVCFFPLLLSAVQIVAVAGYLVVSWLMDKADTKRKGGRR